MHVISRVALVKGVALLLRRLLVRRSVRRLHRL